MIIIRKFTVLAAIILLLNTGCTALQSLPGAARGGDTVALAIGSPDGMDRTNTTAVYVSQSDPNYVPTSDPDYPGIGTTQHALPIRSIFKLYADKASEQYQVNNINTNLITTSGHEPWVTVAAIDLPTDLPHGPGEVIFSSPTSSYPTVGSHIDDVPVSLEILPPSGSGTPADYAATFPYELGLGAFTLGDLTTLEPQEHAILQPTFQGSPGPYSDYGAIEMEIELATSATTLRERNIRVYPDDMTASTNSKRVLDYSLSSNGTTLKVILISSTGKLKYYEARLTIVLNPGITFTSAPSITSVNYYNIDGGTASGPLIAEYQSEVR